MTIPPRVPSRWTAPNSTLIPAAPEVAGGHLDTDDAAVGSERRERRGEMNPRRGVEFTVRVDELVSLNAHGESVAGWGRDHARWLVVGLVAHHLSREWPTGRVTGVWSDNQRYQVPGSPRTFIDGGCVKPD